MKDSPTRSPSPVGGRPRSPVRHLSPDSRPQSPVVREGWGYKSAGGRARKEHVRDLLRVEHVDGAVAVEVPFLLFVGGPR